MFGFHGRGRLLMAVLALGALAGGGALLVMRGREWPVAWGLDRREGTRLRFAVDETALAADGGCLARTAAVLRQRLDGAGVERYLVEEVPPRGIEVVVPAVAVDASESLQRLLQTQADLQFHLEAFAADGIDPAAEAARLAAEIDRRRAAGEAITERTDFSALTRGLNEAAGPVRYAWRPLTPRALCDAARRDDAGVPPSEPRWDAAVAWRLLRLDARPEASFGAADFNEVTATWDPMTGYPAVSFIFEPAVAQLFADFTERNAGRQLCVLFNGSILLQARIESRIPGQGVINGGSGGFTHDEVRQLVALLGAANLPCRLDLVETTSRYGSDGK